MHSKWMQIINSNRATREKNVQKFQSNDCSHMHSVRRNNLCKLENTVISGVISWIGEKKILQKPVHYYSLKP